MSSIDPIQMEIYRQHARQRQRQLNEQVQARREKAWQVARRAAQILRDEFHVTRVVAFGSLTQEYLFHIHSDVDLAVWEMESRPYFKAVSRLLEIDPDFNVDLVLYEDVRPSVQAVIDLEGVEL